VVSVGADTASPAHSARATVESFANMVGGEVCVCVFVSGEKEKLSLVRLLGFGVL